MHQIKCHLRLSLRSLGTEDRSLLLLGLDAALSSPKPPPQAPPQRGGVVDDLGEMGVLCLLHHLLLQNQGRRGGAEDEPR